MLAAVLDGLAGGGAGYTALSLFATGAILWASAIALLRALQPAQADRGVSMRVA